MDNIVELINDNQGRTLIELREKIEAIADLHEADHIDICKHERVHASKEMAMAEALLCFIDSDPAAAKTPVEEYLAHNDCFSVVRVDIAGKKYYSFSCYSLEGFFKPWGAAVQVDKWHKSSFDYIRDDEGWLVED